MDPVTPNPTSLHPRGEIQVWITAAGLATALLMVAGLMALVVWQGLAGFWPRDVVAVTLRPDSASALNGSTTLAGTIVRDREKALAPGREWQLFVGNKETYSLMFHYIDEAEIVDVRPADGIWRAERTDYGDALFYPLELRTEDGHLIEADDSRFAVELQQAVETVRARRKLIRMLEERDIGAINREIESLRLARMHDSGENDAERVRRLAQLDARFNALAARARELRTTQQSGSLRYRLPTGEERSIPLGQLISAHQPNAMNTVRKLGFFANAFGRFLVEEPREANTEGGIFPAIFGTFVTTVLMSVLVMPFGVLTAVYLHEYARQGPLVRGVRIAINNLAGVPSIVFGVFGLGFFVYFVGGTIDELFYADKLPTATFGTGGILWASLTLALMTVPVVVVATEEALAAVPRGVREASLACGASKWQTIQRIVLPVSTPGILTGLILAMARGAGEVAPLMLVGVVKLAPNLPLDATAPFIHLERKFMHLGFHIYDLGFQSPDSEAARPLVFASTLLLIALVVVLNLGAILIRNRLRRRYASHTF